MEPTYQSPWEPGDYVMVRPVDGGPPFITPVEMVARDANGWHCTVRSPVDPNATITLRYDSATRTWRSGPLAVRLERAAPPSSVTPYEEPNCLLEMLRHKAPDGVGETKPPPLPEKKAEVVPSTQVRLAPGLRLGLVDASTGAPLCEARLVELRRHPDSRWWLLTLAMPADGDATFAITVTGDPFCGAWWSPHLGREVQLWLPLDAKLLGR